jgi:hypothetical protein
LSAVLNFSLLLVFPFSVIPNAIHWSKPLDSQKQTRPMRLLTLPFIWILSVTAGAQVACDPAFPTTEGNVTITYDATQGNAALSGVSPVYAHMGVITNLSTSPTDWKHVVTTWGVADANGLMQANGPNKWTKTINIKTFFTIQANETVLKLAFVFRNANGSIVGRAADGSDIFYEVYPVNGPLQTRFITPASTHLITTAGTAIPVQGAASQAAELSLYDNGNLITTATGLSLQTSLTAAEGVHAIHLVAEQNGATDTAAFTYLVPAPTTLVPLPPGTEPGIQYLDDQTVRLSLFAPFKQVVYVLGDFNNWQPHPDYQMQLSTDNATWWIDLNNLPAGQPVRFQYLVNGIQKIADPLSTLVLQQGEDAYIPTLTYPNKPAYPSGKTTGAVSVLQTAQPAYNWTATDYVRPRKTDLVVYELLVRDFVGRQNYQTIRDTLDYLQRLGVTAIELMPVQEFEGNLSWGYNPAYHKALDKFYGDADALKALIDACHHRGIAVIIDVVFNQAAGSSPLAQLYWDAANNRPAPNNPWLNPVAKHDFNVFNDFNHESAATKNYVKSCLKYLIETYRVDGFRFDLSKGFTQKNTLGNTSAWGQYDASRVSILKGYADYVWSLDPENFVILEHFADNTEEKVLAEYGMMLWGNLHGAYKEVGLGTTAGQSASLSGISYKNRNWTVPHLIGYMESHDEERIIYEMKNYGSSNGTYNVKSLPTALSRMAMLHNILFTVPGPKMLWQFGELGYDFPINYCGNGSISPSCRTDAKPIRWDYLAQAARRNLYGQTAGLLQLRRDFDVFETTDFTLGLSSGKVRWVRLNHPTLHALAVSNMSTATETASLTFAHTGTWYDYYTGAPLVVNTTTTAVTLPPGGYRLFLDAFVPFPEDLVVVSAEPEPSRGRGLQVFPNPVTELLTVAIDLTDAATLDVQITDVAGRLVHRQTATAVEAGTWQLEIPAANWLPGFYVLSVYDEHGLFQAGKLLKGARP